MVFRSWLEESKTRTASSTGWPDASRKPKFARYATVCATCCSESTEPRPTKFANGVAGMNCPNVPFGVKLYVRLDATVCSCCCAVSVTPPKKPPASATGTGRTSSMPSELPIVPEPNALATTSSSAIVTPGGTSIVLEMPVCVPSTPEGVKLRSYFIVCAVRFVRRMSDSNSESLMPDACPTAAKISASGGGVPLPVGITGVTRLTDTGSDTDPVSLRAGPSLAPPLYVTCSVAVFVPMPRWWGSAVTVRVRPSIGSVPLDGVTVSHGLSARTVNCCGALPPLRKTFCTIAVSVPSSVLALFVFGSTTNTPTTSEYGPRSSLQSAMPRTR